MEQAPARGLALAQREVLTLINAWVPYTLAGLCMILGFIALLLQKTYIDSQTSQLTEVDLPLVGKLKTNYPALAFVIFGVFLAGYTLSKTTDVGTDLWDVQGSFLAPPGAAVTWKWEDGVLTGLPKDAEFVPYQNGSFRIQANVPHGKSFADVYSTIMYTNGPVMAEINVQDMSLIKFRGERKLEYVPVPVSRLGP